VPVQTRTIPIEGPLDLRATLRPLHGWFGGDGWWLTARTVEGPASLRVRRDRSGLIGEAWGEGAEWMLDRLTRIAGLHDDPATFVTDHPIVAPLHRANPGLRFGSTGLVFDALVGAVCGQKVTGSEAVAALRGLRSRFSEPAPGPTGRHLLLPPDPERMAAAPYWEYHEIRLEKKRADVLRRLATRSATIAGLAEKSSPEAASALIGLPGIGPWSVAKTLIVSHGDPDQVEVGDFHLKHIVVHHLTGRARGSDDEMLELLAPFAPHRGRVTRLLHGLGHEPSFGPRTPVRDFTSI
jgi:3-methyladenine DNA glycosylase/8-oxoguanine DNA glycosylase